MDVVYPVADAALTLSTGATFVVRRGQHWPVEDALVKEHPGQFSDDPRYGLAFSSAPPEQAEAPVEQATAVPGERRSVRRG